MNRSSETLTLLLRVFLLSLVSFTAARDVSCQEFRFEPEGFRSGDRVTVSFELEAKGRNLEPFVDARPDLVARKFDDPEIVGASLEERGDAWVFSLVFKPWKPGPGKLPPLSFGALTIPPIPFTTGTLSDKDDEHAPYHPQFELPGTGSLFTLLVSVGILVASAALFMAFIALPGLRRLMREIAARKAYTNARKVLSWLSNEGAGASPESILSSCENALRRYMGETRDYAYLSLTSRELSSHLAASSLPPGAVRESRRDGESGNGDGQTPSRRLRGAGEDALSRIIASCETGRWYSGGETAPLAGTLVADALAGLAKAEEERHGLV